MKTPRLKSTRSAERKKVDLAVNYQEEGKATGGGRTRFEADSPWIGGAESAAPKKTGQNFRQTANGTTPQHLM